MKLADLKIRCTDVRGGFVGLPGSARAAVQQLGLPVFLRLRPVDAQDWAGLPLEWVWAVWGGGGAPQGMLEIDRAAARVLHLTEGQTVEVHTTEPMGVASAVTVRPLSADDWELLQLHAEYVEGQALNQHAVAARGQVLPLYLPDRSHAAVEVVGICGETAPMDVGRLTNQTELHIAPVARIPQDGEEYAGKASLRVQMMPVRRGGVNARTAYVSPSLLRELGWRDGETVALSAKQMTPIRPAESVERHNEFRPLPLSEEPHSSPTSASSSLSEKRVAQKRQEKSPLSSSSPLIVHTYARVKSYQGVGRHGVAVGLALRVELGISLGTWIRVCPTRRLGITAKVIRSVQMRPFRITPHSARCTGAMSSSASLSKQLNVVQLEEGDAMPVTNGSLLGVKGTGEKNLEEGKHHCAYILTCNDHGKEGGTVWDGGADFPPLYVISSSDVTLATDPQSLSAEEYVHIASPLESTVSIRSALDSADFKKQTAPVISNILSQLLIPHNWISHMLGSSQVIYKEKPCHYIITGARGSGKTTCALAIASHLQTGTWRSLHLSETVKGLGEALPDVGVYADHLAMRDLAELPLGALTAHLRQRLGMAASNAPSCVILDDLDSACGQIPEDGPQAGAVKTSQLSEYILDLLSILQRGAHRVVVISTCKDVDSLNVTLRRAQVLGQVVSLPSLGPADRARVLLQLLQRMNASTASLQEAGSPSVSLEKFSKSCEGFVARDLKNLGERALHNAATRTMQALSRNATGFTQSANLDLKVSIELRDLELARRGFSPASLQGVPLLKDAQKSASWNDLGGLGDVRKLIRETYEWPIKYSGLFAELQKIGRSHSGILLYGPPGCGKTLVANIVASEYKDYINFIAVKGPELLNKYIGASEQSVRQIFEKAAAAQPCILFFDEFEAIAPKRGHDNTGVTDRVVNQLLTELDGVDRKSGVYVLAATSRPDLIDAALLRPGRLDKSVYCGMPETEDRNEILRAVASKMTLSEDVDLKKLSVECTGYTGADLQALLYNAQLNAVHDVLDGEGGESSQAVPRVTQGNIRAAFGSTRPSLSASELQRLQNVYSNFKRSGEGGKGEQTGKRMTLA